MRATMTTPATMTLAETTTPAVAMPAERTDDRGNDGGGSGDDSDGPKAEA